MTQHHIPQLVATLARREPPSDLEREVLARIHEYMRQRVRSRILVFSISAIAGIGIMIDLGTHLAHAITRSGFYEYISLAFSGDGAVLTLWKEWGMSLLESLPMVGVIGILAALAFVLWAGANAVTNVRKIGALATA